MAKRIAAKTLVLGTCQVNQALKDWYGVGPRATHALLFEVGNGTGMACSRHADALAMGLWPSRGLDLIGHEIKASRSDWIKELNDPAKADSIARYCDKWYLVVGNAQIVQDGELPEPWGLMVPDEDGGLMIAKKAPVLSPQPISRPFLAAMLRRVVEQSVDNEELAEAKNAGIQDGIEREKRNHSCSTRRHAELLKVVNDFETASGVMLANAWNASQIGEAVKLVLAGGHNREEQKLRSIRAVAANIVFLIDGCVTSEEPAGV